MTAKITDALIEQANEEQIEPGTGDFEQWINKAHTVDAYSIVSDLKKGLNNWGGKRTDDLTIFAICRDEWQKDNERKYKNSSSNIFLSLQSYESIDPSIASVAQASSVQSDPELQERRRAQKTIQEHVPQRLIGPGGDYEIKEQIGRGGMGDVFAAKERGLERIVALKIANGREEKSATNFLLEPLVNAVLEHPNIVPVHALGNDEDQGTFFTMRKLHGRTWSDAFLDLSLDEHLAIIDDLCDAVALAHDQGIIHRDIKPSNVFIGNYGEVQLSDWGLAASIGPGPLAHVLPLTDTRSISGTPAYMSPEMADPQSEYQVGPAADIYMLGACLIEVLTGKAPHTDSSLHGALQHARKNELSSLPDHPLSEVIRRACASQPNRRYQKAQDLKKALQEYRHNAQAYILTEEAKQLAENRDDDYGLFRAAWSCEQALRINPNDQSARQLFSQIRSQHARLALKREDRDLASQLLDPSDPLHTDALALLEEANRLAEKQSEERLHLNKLVERTNSTWQVIREGSCDTDNPEEWEQLDSNISFANGRMRVIFEVNGMLAHTTRLSSGARFELRGQFAPGFKPWRLCNLFFCR